MILKSLTISNFKAIREPVKIEFKPITLLFGPNSAGKSTIVQSLLYLRDVVHERKFDVDRTSFGGDAFDLGGFQNFIHNRDGGRELIFKVELGFDGNSENLAASCLHEFFDEVPDVHPIWKISDKIKSVEIEMAISWNAVKQEPRLTRYGININGKRIAVIELTMTSHKLTYFDRAHPALEETHFNDESALFLEDLSQYFDNTIRGSSAPYYSLELSQFSQGLPSLHSAIRIEDLSWDNWLQSRSDENDPNLSSDLSLFFTMILSCPIKLLADDLNKLLYLGPLREIPARNFDSAKSHGPDRWAKGLGAWDYLNECEDSTLSRINHWLSHPDKLDSGYEVSLKSFREVPINTPLLLLEKNITEIEDYQNLIDELKKLPVKKKLRLRDVKQGLEFQPQDIGIGISQILPVVVSTLMLQDGLLMLEQPELHIHPALQVSLGDLFIERTNEFSGQFFCLIETHSEHIMLRLLRRIRETSESDMMSSSLTLTPDDVAVYFLESNDGCLRSSKIRIDENGDFKDPWPKGFFAERSKELF